MTERLRSSAFLLLLMLSAAAVSAQNQYTPIAPLPLGVTLLNIPTENVLPEGVWELNFSHRFSQAINHGDVHTLWGLDSPADVVFGLAWSPVRDLQVSLDRSNEQDDIEGALKYAIIRQAPAVPVSVTARVGGDWRTEIALTRRGSVFGQVILSRQFLGKGEISLVPTFATNAGELDHAFNVPIGLAWVIAPNVSVVAEIIPVNRSLPSDTRGDIGWSVGLKKAIGGHFFEILLSDSRASLVDQYMAGDFQGSLHASDLHLGFNIERRFGRAR